MATRKAGQCPFVHSNVDVHAFDMLDPDARANPHPYYQWLQADPTRRVYRAPHEAAFYIVHHYDDVKAVLTNHRQFSNAILPTHRSPFLALMDGDDHRRLRDVVNRMFAPDAETEARIADAITLYTEQLIAAKHAALFDAWATPIPLTSLAITLGIDTSLPHIQKLHQHAIVINKALFVLGGTGERRSADPTFAEKIRIAATLAGCTPKLWRLKKFIGMQGLSVLREMFAPVSTSLEMPRPKFAAIPAAMHSLLDLMLTFAEALETARPTPALGHLRQSIAEGKISRVEAVMLCTFILFAGYETSVSLLSNCVAQLAYHPSWHDTLRRSPEKIEAFIEESLRYYTPVGRFLRRATDDVLIGDTTVPKGAIVIAMLGAANVDPTRFEDPYTFSLKPQSDGHISFGKGIHFCVGAPLARFQAHAAIAALVSKTTRIEIDHEQPSEMVTDRDNGILRFEQLWVRLFTDKERV